MAQELQTTNNDDSPRILRLARTGRIVSLDPGTKHIGVAVCDEMQLTARPLPVIERSSWKKLLLAVKATISDLDAVALVIGLPLNSDGSESEMSADAREMTKKFGLSLEVPVFLQDERVSTYEARRRIWRSEPRAAANARVHSEAACVILGDFLERIGSLRHKNG